MKTNKKILILLITTILSIFYGSAQNMQKPVKDKKVFCEIIEKVFSDENWKVCGNIVIFDNGNYLYKAHDVWQNSKHITKIFEGKIPKKIFIKLTKSISDKKWVILKGKHPTYEFFIDNNKAIHPDGVTELTNYLQHEILKNKTNKKMF